MSADPETLDCRRDCNSACCRAGMLLDLTRVEVDFVSQGGTELTTLVPAPEANLEGKTSLGRYKLAGDCGYLALGPDGWGCSAHDNPERPEACRQFKPGGMACQGVRAAMNKQHLVKRLPMASKPLPLRPATI